MLEEALALFKDIGSKHQIASTTLSLAQVECLHGYLDWAESLLTEATRLAVEAAGSSLATAVLGSWALLARRRGDPGRAVMLWAAAEAQLDELGLTRDALFRHLSHAEIEALREAVPEDDFAQAWSDGGRLGWVETLEQGTLTGV